MDYKNIQNKFDEVVRYTQTIDEPKTDGLFKTWYKNKKHFIDKWGGLSVELPNVAINISDQQKQEQYELLVDYVWGWDNKTNGICNYLMEQGIDALYDNKVLKDYEVDGKKIPLGMKLTKSLKFFCDDTNKATLDKIQTRMSRIRQEATVNGTLVMSVHPLDFLSSSENAHNWRSCHALDGEYAAGNLSYMSDKHTFICYLKSENDMEISRFPFEWNSKKWRVLMFLREDDQLIMAGKQYPFDNNALFNTLFDELIAPQYPEINWNEKWLKPPTATIGQIMQDELGSLHFNDCLNSSSYRPVIRHSNELTSSDLLWHFTIGLEKMLIGDGVECLECGMGMISLSSEFKCPCCGDYTTCDSCGESISNDDIYTVGDECLCCDCAFDVTEYCDCCDTAYHIHAVDFSELMHYDEEDEVYYCKYCMANMSREKS